MARQQVHLDTAAVIHIQNHRPPASPPARKGEWRSVRTCGPTRTDLTSCTERTISSACSIRTTAPVRWGTAWPRKWRLRLMMKMATAPIMPPTAMEPHASYIGLPVT
eukprot:scaffold10560_cov133-Isochrysis_galbana.AAC.19